MKYYFSFDVESTELLGTPIAVGWSVQDEFGVEVDWNGYRLDFDVIQDSSDWVTENVYPAIKELNIVNNFSKFSAEFWDSWITWGKKGALLVCDCPWPVEANFLLKSSIGYPARHKYIPYPIIDVSSVLFSAGLNPIGTYDRAENEFIVHNPIHDARQSCRILLRTLKSLS